MIKHWLYFGCHEEAGHFLHGIRMRRTYEPRALNHFDGLLAPQDASDPYIATFSRIGGWGLSAISFWDYSVDKRGKSNSIFYAPTLALQPQEMLEAAKRGFPSVFARLPQEVVWHPSVKPDCASARIKHMVDRFLGWRLPENFNPDAGISFKATFNEHTDHPMKHEPTGTNLLDATQADAMVRYMLEGVPPSP